MSNALHQEHCKLLCFYPPSSKADGHNVKEAVILRCSSETVSLELESNGRSLDQWTLEALPGVSERGVIMAWEGDVSWTRGGEDVRFEGFWRPPTQAELLDLGPAQRVARILSGNTVLEGLPVIHGHELEDGQNVLLTGQEDDAHNGVWAVGPGAWTRPNPSFW